MNRPSFQPIITNVIKDQQVHQIMLQYLQQYTAEYSAPSEYFILDREMFAIRLAEKYLWECYGLVSHCHGSAAVDYKALDIACHVLNLARFPEYEGRWLEVRGSC